MKSLTFSCLIGKIFSRLLERQKVTQNWIAEHNWERPFFIVHLFVHFFVLFCFFFLSTNVKPFLQTQRIAPGSPRMK